MNTDVALLHLAKEVGAALNAQEAKVATAESCTGGGIAQLLTAIPGSSSWFERGWVVYSNAAKSELLGVSPHLISNYGAVSEATALALARGALERSPAKIALAVTGVAGPDGGSMDTPVGTVCFAWCQREQIVVDHSATMQFNGNRTAVRQQAVAFSLRGLLKWLSPSLMNGIDRAVP